MTTPRSAAGQTPTNPIRLQPHSGWLLVVFGIVSLANVLGQAIGSDPLTWATKPLLMPILFVWAWRQVSPIPSRANRWLLIGMVFAWLGDLLLMPTGDLWFIAGIGGFLLMQISYITAYLHIPGPGLLRSRWWLALPYLAFAVGMNLLLDPGALGVPVVIYSLVLVGMGAAALDLTARFPSPFGVRVAVGAALFVISDATIAIGAFSAVDLGNAGAVIVMGTYVIAQFLIVTNFINGGRLLDADRVA